MENIVFSLEDKGNNLLLGEEDLNTFFASEADTFDVVSSVEVFIRFVSVVFISLTLTS